MEASAGRSFSTLAWIGCWIGLVVLGIVGTTGSYYIDTTVTVVALLAMAGPLVAKIIISVNVNGSNDDGSPRVEEFLRPYKSWRIQTMVYFYMMAVSCIGFTLMLDGAYQTSDKDIYTNSVNMSLTLFLAWLAFLVINTTCFLVVARKHNRSSYVMGDEFQESIRLILAEIDEYNGIKPEKTTSKGHGSGFGKRRKSDSAEDRSFGLGKKEVSKKEEPERKPVGEPKEVSTESGLMVRDDDADDRS